jgi:hypothetical protein
MSRRRCLLASLLTLTGGITLMLFIAGCGESLPARDEPTAASAPSTVDSTDPSEPAAAPTSSDTTVFTGSDNGGPGTPEYDGIPRPIVDGSVEWYRYLGDGHFITETGREFFWRDGHFVNADGTLMEIPESVKEHLHSIGIDRQPTIPPVLSPGKAALVEEVERIRHGLLDGTLVFDWQVPEGSDLPAGPGQVLDDLEGAAFRPDLYVYLRASTDDAWPLYQEIHERPEVQYVEWVTKDEAFLRMQREWKDNPEILENLESDPTSASILIWLDDPAQADQFVQNLQGRSEIDEVQVPSMDFAQWTALLRAMTHAKP